jgi:ABC-2 type transport system ATP-binding protein
MSEPVVEVRGLSKRFGGSVLAVDDLSFEVAQVQICGLLGRNGAGQQTAMRVLLGLIYPTAGEARLFDQRVRPGSPLLGRVGALIEQAAFVPHLSGMTNLKLWWESGGSRIGEADLEAALAIAGLGDAIDRKVKTYSQGMRQRLGLARVLLGRPEVLVLDEPTNGLDPGEMREVRQLVQRVADAGATVLFSSHILAEVEQVCTHAVVMDKGRLVASGSVTALIGTSGSGAISGRRHAAHVLQSPRRPNAEPPGRKVDQWWFAWEPSRAVREGVGVETAVSRRRLEDAFLGLVEARGDGSPHRIGQGNAATAYLRLVRHPHRDSDHHGSRAEH